MLPCLPLQREGCISEEDEAPERGKRDTEAVITISEMHDHLSNRAAAYCGEWVCSPEEAARHVFGERAEIWADSPTAPTEAVLFDVRLRNGLATAVLRNI